MSRPNSPSPEVEITPEMIEAGAKVIADCFETSESFAAWIVKDVFDAMYAVRAPNCGEQK